MFNTEVFSKFNNNTLAINVTHLLNWIKWYQRNNMSENKIVLFYLYNIYIYNNVNNNNNPLKILLNLKFKMWNEKYMNFTERFLDNEVHIKFY